MRRILLSLLATVCVLSMWADEPFRNHRYDSFKVLSPAEGSIVFIGNSITDMHFWPEVFKDKDGNYLPIVNRGNSGGYSTEQSNNLEAYLGKKPAKVFMMIGTNDIATNGNNFGPEQLLNYIKSIVNRIHARYPETEIYLYSILPNNTSNRPVDRVTGSNAVIKAYVEATNANWLTYIDLYDKLAGIANNNDYSYDRLHPTAAAYRIWTDAICQYLGEGVTTLYPANTIDVQQNGGLGSSNGMRATASSVMPISTDDVLVFGDEMIKCGEWQELLGSPNIKNRGNGWGYGGNIDGTSKLVDATYANTGVTKQDAKAIFLYTGTADANGNANIEQVKADYKALVDKIKAKSPSSKLYLMSLCPVTTAATNTNRVTVLNAYMKSLADESADDNVKYLDIYTTLVSNGVANSKYFYPANYLGGLGYVKVAQKMKEALVADFPSDTYTVLTDAEAETNKTQADLRCQISQAIANGLLVEVGDEVGQYGAALMDQFNTEAAAATALLAKNTLTEAEVTEEVSKLNTLKLQALNMPKASTDTEENWYQFTSLRLPLYHVTATGVVNGVQGTNTTANKATSMWKFVLRDDNSYDIVNREYNCYLQPTATYNTQITTVAERPSTGWTLSYANTPGYYIISSGEVQLNQTQGAQNYKIYNWSNEANKGSDRSDVGCQFKISVANEPEVVLPNISYIVDKENGIMYHSNGSIISSYACVWKSSTEGVPQLQFGCGTTNNMNWNGDNVNLFTGQSGSSVYTITPPAGYVIEEYSFSFANSGHTTAITLTMEDGKVYTTSSEIQTISKTKQRLASVSFTLAGTNGKPVTLTDFTVKVKLDVPEKPQISTEGEEHWYYITNAASNSNTTYCAGKVMYYDEEVGAMRFGDKKFLANRIWSFWEKDGKIAIKNYSGEYFDTPPSGTGNATRFGVVGSPNYVYTIEDSFGFFIIKDSGTELHAQSDGQVIVRWGAAAGNASLWRFDEVDVSNATATVSATRVVQGKVTTGIGNKDQAIIRSTLTVSGLTESCQFEGVKGTFSGTRAADVTKVKAYFALNPRELFVDADNKMPWRNENGELFGEATLNADNTFTITGSKALIPGEHYLWIAYDIADDAKEGNTVDAAITSYTVDGEEVEESNGNPAHAVTVFLSEGSVLMPMDKGSLYYRIPSITLTKDGKRLVALSDDRKDHAADLPRHCYVVAQYSDDEGRTWSDPVTVAGTAELGGDYGHGDASLVTDRVSGRIIGIMTSAGPYGHGFFGGTAQEPPRWKTIISEDNGLTWSKPIDHTDDLFGANCSNPKTQTWKSGFSGSGAALQLRDGTLVSSFVNREADNSQNFYFFMSDDYGDSWYVSGTSGTTAADEPKTLERNNGDLAISVRAGGYNFHNVTSDRGENWHYPAQTRFTSGISGNACDGEYMVWCSTLEGNPWNIAFQTLPNSGSRQNVSIALSTDEGETFLTPKTICPIGSCYSAATVLPDGTLGVYYEENGVYGGFTMRFVRFSLDWASNGAYKFTEDNPYHPIKVVGTGISDVISVPSQASDAIYDLQGRRVNAPSAPGIYISNGKKILYNK